MTNELDEFDRRILNVLQDDNRITNLALADRVAMSAPTCLRRLRRLRDSGVISRDVSIVDPAAVGRHLRVIVQVSLEREKLDLINDFGATMNKFTEVMSCYLVTGDADFLLVLLVNDIDAYYDFARRALYGNVNVRRFTTSIVMETMKQETKVHL